MASISIVGSQMLVITIMLSFSMSLGNYQYLVMVHQWGPALCRISDIKCTKTPANAMFLIHGIWPTNHSDPQPRDCTLSDPNDRKLDTKKFPTGLLNKLRISWPSLTGKDENFWQLQWERHGTCSFPKFNQKEYFKLALNRWQSMDLFNILKKQGISPSPYNTPSQKYHQEDIEKAIKIFHFKGHAAIKPQFHCRGSELLEIRLCLDHDGFDYFNCTSNKNTCGPEFEWFL